uniref:Uncharacterized protein n=1 Tax=Amphimedon queenslandica TaxID=400682 RepID=A0A1X7V905_AMPQE
MHIDVLMLCRKFELIPIKIGFFMNFLSCSKIVLKSLYYIVQGTWPNFAKIEKKKFSIFIILSNTYTCTYAI